MTSSPEKMSTQLSIDASMLSRRETTTKRRVLVLTLVGAATITLGATLFGYMAYSNLRETVQALKFAEASSASSQTAAQSAAAAAEQAQRLADRLQRSMPVIAVSPDHNWSVSRSGWLVDANGTPTVQIAASAGLATFSPDGVYLFVSPLASTVASVLVRTNQASTTVVEFPSGFGDEPGFEVSSAKFSQDGSTLTLISVAGIAELFDLRSGSVVAKARGLSVPLSFAAFSRDGKQVVGVAADGTATLRDLSTNRTAVLAYVSTKGVFAAAFDSASGRVMLAYHDGFVRIFDIASGTVVDTFDGFIR